MYEPVDILNLSKDAIRRLLNGKGVICKHGQGMKIPVSKEQYKKLMKAHAKDKGCVLTLDPYQQMQGTGLFGNIGSAFQNLGRQTASTLIHSGLPLAGSYAGSAAGSALGTAASGPIGGFVGGVAGGQAGSMLGERAASEISKRTGLGMKKKRGRPRKGGTLLIDQPFTVRQGIDQSGQFFKDPLGKIGFGMVDDALQYARQYAPEARDEVRNLLHGSGDMVSTVGKPFARDLGRAFGAGVKRGRPRKGGTLLIDQPFTIRQGVENTGEFFQNPMGKIGFGMFDMQKDDRLYSPGVVDKRKPRIGYVGSGFGVQDQLALGREVLKAPFDRGESLKNEIRSRTGLGMKRKGKGVFSSLAKAATPFLKRAGAAALPIAKEMAKEVGREALQYGIQQVGKQAKKRGASAEQVKFIEQVAQEQAAPLINSTIERGFRHPSVSKLESQFGGALRAAGY